MKTKDIILGKEYTWWTGGILPSLTIIPVQIGKGGKVLAKAIMGGIAPNQEITINVQHIHEKKAN